MSDNQRMYGWGFDWLRIVLRTKHQDEPGILIFQIEKMNCAPGACFLREFAFSTNRDLYCRMIDIWAVAAGTLRGYKQYIGRNC